MSEFELTTIILSFIVGFGVTGILTSIVALARSGEPIRLDWMPLAWTLGIFIDQVQFWFGVMFLQQVRPLTGAYFWMVILAACLLFLAGGLILPSERRGLPADLLDDFDRFGRRAVAAYGAFCLVAFGLNLYAGVVPFSGPTGVNLALAVCSGVTYGVRHRPLQRAATVLALGLIVFAVLFVSSRPGAVDLV
jgi:hypothetical protein